MLGGVFSWKDIKSKNKHYLRNSRSVVLSSNQIYLRMTYPLWTIQTGEKLRRKPARMYYTTEVKVAHMSDEVHGKLKSVDS